MRHAAIFCVTAVAASSAVAQAQSFEADTIQVSGRGSVFTAPDVAILNFWVTGEGRSPDEATRRLADRQTSVTAGVRGLLGAGTEVTNSELVLIETRDARCGVENRPRLSEGECAVTGYVARSMGTVRTANVGRSGTAVGLAGRLGAGDARLQSFQLSGNRRLRQEALNRAMADARSQAETLAIASGRKLGRILNVRDSYYGDYSASLERAVAVSASPPPPPPPPIEVDVKPRPIETSAQVQVTFALEP